MPTSAELRALAGSARDAMTDGARYARDAVTRGAQHPVARKARDAVTRGAQHPVTVSARETVARGARQAVGQGARTVRDPSRRWKAGVIGVVAIGTIAGVGASAPWASAATQGTSSAGWAQSGPTTFYDSTSPGSIPAGQHAAVYADGAYQASTSSVQGRGNVLWIDTNGSDTNANALDVEPGDATPAQAAQWVNAKLSANPDTDAIVYTFKSDWTSVQDSINTLPSWEQSHVKYWIADPTGTPHIVPGAAATQWYWGSNYDISQATPGFFS